MRSGWLQTGLLLLAATPLVVGVWALLLPRSFYDDFPSEGRDWVSALGPYDEHLVRDVGALNLALCALLVFAAVGLEKQLVQAALVAWLQVISKVVEACMLGRMRNTELTDEQWGSLAPLLPPRRPRGRPRAEDRKTLNGILYVLRTGCRWEDVPREYGSPTTCWRRLKAWEEDGTWEKVWRGLLALLDEREDLDWDRAFLDGSFIPAKKGDARLGRPSGARAPS